MNSEQVTAGVNGEAVRLPETVPTKFHRFEMYGRSAFGDQPLRDDEGKPIVYTDLEIAEAHLADLPDYDENSSVPTVFFFRAVHTLNEDGSSKHWYNVNKTETVEIPSKELDSRGKYRDVLKLVTRTISEEYAAMEKFRELRKAKASASSALRRQLFTEIGKFAAAR
jgi:hypothetical protein